MLRKSKSNAGIIPGAVSSTTIEGVLPQYSGHASACLAPTLANAAPTPNQRPSGTAKFGALAKFSQEIHNENTPPLSIRD